MGFSSFFIRGRGGGGRRRGSGRGDLMSFFFGHYDLGIYDLGTSQIRLWKTSKFITAGCSHDAAAFNIYV